MSGHILVLDQGTTSSRAIAFGPDMKPFATGQQEFRQLFPQAGWVEHDPEDIWQSTLTTVREALAKTGLPAAAYAGLGIANQRETTIIWNRATGKPIYNAIVWQDRRTSAQCAQLKRQGHEALVTQKTGLLLDPYFPATKIVWLLDNIPDARQQAERGELAFGTVDSFLIWRLTNGKVHATDATNASRSLLFNIHDGVWDDELLQLFNIPRALLPIVQDCAFDYGNVAAEHFGMALPIRGVAGDQQAALIGQACFSPGMVKSTFGTGGFILLNIGAQAFISKHRLLTTIAYQWRGQRTYAVEGSIFSAGATVQWLRDGLGIVASAAETAQIAADADANQPVYFVPAFTGMGAPHWDSEARAAILGLTRGTTRKEIVRAALESVAYQTRDLIEAMRAGGGLRPTDTLIRIDGGMSASDWTMQFLADMIDAPVDRPASIETTALGAAFLAGWQAGIYPGPEEFAKNWQLERRFRPAMPSAERDMRYNGWTEALARILAPHGAVHHTIG